MKTLLKLSCLTAASLLLAACLRNDTRTETFYVENLHSPESAQQLANSLRTVSGVQEIRSDLSQQTITVIFDGRVTYLKNIEAAIVKAGFDLPHWPDNALKETSK